MLSNKDTLMSSMLTIIGKAIDRIDKCKICNNLTEGELCSICSDLSRDKNIICVVEDIFDLWAVEKSNAFNGFYHVLSGSLSVTDGRTPESIGINKLIARIKHESIKEVIIATNATIEGQTTAHYIASDLHDIGVNITRLANGVPLGGELNYMDEGTLNIAFNSRRSMDI